MRQDLTSDPDAVPGRVVCRNPECVAEGEPVEISNIASLVLCGVCYVEITDKDTAA